MAYPDYENVQIIEVLHQYEIFLRLFLVVSFSVLENKGNKKKPSEHANRVFVQHTPQQCVA